MKRLQMLASIALIGVLGGCATLGVGQDVERMRAAQGRGDAFTRALTDEYRALMAFEADEMYDWKDADYYARRGLRAAAGEVFLPQKILERRLPAEYVGELTSARSDLVGLLFAGARDKVPGPSARAQAMFECWMEQQEENFQPEHIKRCRDGFHAALAEMKAAMAPKPVVKAAPAPAPAPTPAPAPVAAVPVRFIVYFGFDSSQLTPASITAIEDAIAAARKMGGGVEFSVTGHADRAGPADYNEALSIRRATAVSDALIARGVASNKVGVAGRGEAEPAVLTPDGVREPANRRVEIILLR